MSAQRNKRLAWMAQEISKGKSNSAIVLECMSLFPGVSETTARKDLKELMQRLTEIELENLPEIKTRFMEIGFKLMEDARSLAQLGPAANIFKTMAQMAGVLTEKVEHSGSVGGASGSPAPEASQVRERIAQLMRNKKVREAAKEAEIDLDSMNAKKD